MDDTKNFPIVQVKYYNHVAAIEVLMPYGLCSSPPVGSLVTMFNINGQEENRTGVINQPTKRFKNLQQGEVALSNYMTKAVIYLKENGDIDIQVPSNLTGEVQGNVNITVNGTTNITSAGTTTLTTPLVHMTGNLHVDGDILDQIGSGNSDTMAGMRQIYNNHTHNENDVTGSPTDKPNQQM